MKFRILMSLLLIVVLGGLAVGMGLLETSSDDAPSPPSSSSSSDDSQFKNFRIP